MNPLSILAMIGPLTLYFVFLTLVHFRRRPTLLSGLTDAILLALALSGLFMVGIGPAVIPVQSLINNGDFAWVLLFFLYILSIFLLSSTFSRKIVIYNLESDQVRKILTERLGTLFEVPAGISEADLLKKGGVFFFPTFGITAHVTFFPLLKNATISVLGDHPSPKDWIRFQREIKETFLSISTQRSRVAYIFAGLALILGLAIFG